MSEDLNREILRELKEINNKLDILNSSKGISGTLKVIALIFGFLVIGPLFVVVYLFNLTG
ncbi:MAG: hypothetical protein LKI04_12180 [Paenibacillus lautus]|uniref:hypothetical protein n=1 Tax=Paenibacillus lautus TaxID=1401 RepID=UPI0026F0A72F|nr:hypothetical protein [Paenibacillus lautus]MCI1774759.1 hypothetical protein [Paenibacillus lautus]